MKKSYSIWLSVVFGCLFLLNTLNAENYSLFSNWTTAASDPGTSSGELVLSTNPTPQSCGSLGTIGILVTGGVPDYRIVYSGPESGDFVARNTGPSSGGATLTDLVAGTYTISATDSEGRTASSTVTVTDQSSVLAMGMSIRALACANETGIDLTVSGGTAPYLVTFSGPVAGSVTVTDGTTFLPLPVGTYQIGITDANGCQAGQTATVGVVANDLHCTLQVTNAICTKPGAITVLISGGQPGFTVMYSSGHDVVTVPVEGFNYTFSVPCPGVYDVKVTDANGCVVMESAEVRQDPNNLVFETRAVNGVSGTDGRLEVFFVSGRPLYTVDITGPVNLQLTKSENFVVENLPAGLYSIFIVDANGCMAQRYRRIHMTNEGPNLGGMRVGPVATHPWQPIIQAPFAPAETGSDASPTDFSLVATPDDEAFVVQPGFPNPFRHTTQLQFQLPDRMPVSIAVYDASGRAVHTARQTFDAGPGQYELPLANQPKGIYFFTLTAGPHVETGKLIKAVD